MLIDPAAPSRRGFFLIEAMVAILIFALGILGLVAMGGTAVSSQSDAQYRTEASSLADAIAGEMALGIDRTSEANKAASLADFAHQAIRRRRRCWRRARSAGRAINAGDGAPALPPAEPRCQRHRVLGLAGSDGGQSADLRRRAPATSIGS